MAVERATLIQAARSTLLRVLRGCRGCARRASGEDRRDHQTARGEDRRDRQAWLWREFARRLLRLSFKRRQFAFLGINLRRIKEAGRAA